VFLINNDSANVNMTSYSGVTHPLHTCLFFTNTSSEWECGFSAEKTHGLRKVWVPKTYEIKAYIKIELISIYLK